MKGTKENMTPSGRLRISNHRCWLPKPCSQASQFKIHFHKRFSPATVNLQREGQGEIFILLCWRCTTGRELGEWHGENSYLLLVWRYQLSHSSTAVSRESGVFWVFTVPSTILETVQEETCFVSLFSVFGWSSVIKYRLAREKETRILTGTSHVYFWEMQG